MIPSFMLEIWVGCHESEKCGCRKRIERSGMS